ncbi:MAG TPA: EamA family transporter [Burkholderiales bacterium]|nr:EamA family transporter [Burkholderiales bacterium]
MPAKAYLQALAAIGLWSTLAWLALELARVPPFLLVGSALVVGALCGLPRIRAWRVPPATLLLGVYGLFGFHFCLFLALRRAPPVEANLINYLWPLLIVALAPAFLPGTRLAARHVAGALAGFAGAALIVTGGRLELAAEHAAGYALAAASAFIWASYSLLTKRVAPFPSAAVGLFCLVAGALSLVMHALLEPPAGWSLAQAPLLVALGVGPMGAAFYLWDAALKNGDPRIIGSLAYLTPLGSTLLLVATGAGSFRPSTAAAMVLIVGGAALGAGAWPRARKR